jgi:monofunctional glycosyltransferase
MSRRGPLANVQRAVIASLAFLLVFLFAIYATLPDVRPLSRHNPETTAFIELRAREAAARGQQAKRLQRWVPYARISPHLTTAVRVTEDSAFFQHEGIDLEELKKSMETNFDRMRWVRGGSTITQQLAKNLYLSPSKDPLRKFRELLIARHLEVALTKQRIFELYLNVIEWGDGIYGADAAARAYFGLSAGGLSPEQSALLAGAIANPRLMSPARPSRRLRARQRMILRRMGYGTRPPDWNQIADPSTLDTPDDNAPVASPPVLGTPVPAPRPPETTPQPPTKPDTTPTPQPFPQPAPQPSRTP